MPSLWNLQKCLIVREQVFSILWKTDAYIQEGTKITSYFPKSFSTKTLDDSFCKTAMGYCHNWSQLHFSKCDHLSPWLPMVSWLQKEYLGVAESLSMHGYSLCNTSAKIWNMCWCVLKLVREDVELIELKMMWIHNTAWTAVEADTLLYGWYSFQAFDQKLIVQELTKVNRKHLIDFPCTLNEMTQLEIPRGSK